MLSSYVYILFFRNPTIIPIFLETIWAIYNIFHSAKWLRKVSKCTKIYHFISDDLQNSFVDFCWFIDFVFSQESCSTTFWNRYLGTPSQKADVQFVELFEGSLILHSCNAGVQVTSHWLYYYKTTLNCGRELLYIGHNLDIAWKFEFRKVISSNISK